MGEIYTISPSGLDVFLNCPRKYHFEYTAEIPEPQNVEKTSLQWLGANERGTMIHRAMELYVTNVIVPISEKLDTAEAVHGSVDEANIVAELDAIIFLEVEFENAWKQAVVEMENALQKKSKEALIVPLSAKEKELSEAKTDCEAAIKYMLGKMVERKQYPIAAELKFGKRKSETEGEALILSKVGEEDIAICGLIDRVDYDTTNGQYIVVDYKTGSFDKKKKLRSNGRDDLLQDRMYALAFEKMHAGKLVAGSRYVFPSDNNQEIFEEMDSTSKAIFVDRFWNEIKEIRTRQDKACKGNEVDYPDCEYTCRYCNYAKLCEACDELEAKTMAMVTD